MTEERTSGWIHIAVAVIGVAGSLAVAWMTTQAKFASELESKAGEITQLKVNLETAEKRLTQQQQEMDKKVAAVEERLKKLDMQIDMAQTAASTFMKLGGGLFTGSKKKD